MKISIKRTTYTGKSTQGELTIDGAAKPFCYTLEPPRAPAGGGQGVWCIPAGTFRATLYASPKWTDLRGYSYLVPLLQDVPGRSEIEIHIGNTASDTLGCTLVGATKSKDALGYSEDTFLKLLHRILGSMAKGESLTVEYLDTLN